MRNTLGIILGVIAGFVGMLAAGSASMLWMIVGGVAGYLVANATRAADSAVIAAAKTMNKVDELATKYNEARNK